MNPFGLNHADPVGAQKQNEGRVLDRTSTAFHSTFVGGHRFIEEDECLLSEF